ncbi:MAG: hypothetical protein RL376_272, partial [Verrucomicrobiota bacterium]
EIDSSTGRAAPLGLLLPARGTPCSWPDLLRTEGVSVILVGGMGAGARTACAEQGITVVPGISAAPLEQIAADYAAGRILPGENACGDGHGHHDHAHGHSHDHEHGHACCHREG